MSDPTEICVNLNSPVIHVRHTNLQRWDLENSLFKSCCPACDKGVLLVARDLVSFKLLREDRCIACGQRVRYTDLKIGSEEFHVTAS